MNEQTREWPGGIAAVTLFVDDLAPARTFYREVFGLEVVYEDEDSAVFKFGNTLINLLRETAASSLVEPAAVAPVGAGSAFSSLWPWTTSTACVRS